MPPFVNVSKRFGQSEAEGFKTVTRFVFLIFITVIKEDIGMSPSRVQQCELGLPIHE